MEHGILVYCPRHKLTEVPTPPGQIDAEGAMSMSRDLEVIGAGLRPEAGHPGSPSRTTRHS